MLFRSVADGAIELEAEVPEIRLPRLAPGQKVRIASGDPVAHTAVSADNAWTFDEKSSSFTAPAKAGTYAFFCGVHGKGMSGTLTVA